ncbi:hypothetical protein RHGRI_020713 [Rhododendron griersonianum]|uniref:Uncharacterized protein n=1 Tax=Rhododendron griersonianum TaxID=479676 RepID=A0AAV6JLY1_9ERIC|nr:hypothetical protein RHGRI_020713 [Rhododendron griersonianum]
MMSLHHADDPLMCKMFPSSLGILGLLWFNKLPSKSVPDYKALSALFLQRFVTSQKIKDIDLLLRSGKTEPGRGGKAVHNIQKGKGKDRWGEQGGGGYQRDYVRGPKPHEFEAGPIVFKDPLHELLKKIKHEPYFSLPADNIPCPKVKDNKYRYSYHAKRNHLTTWCPQFKDYL